MNVHNTQQISEAQATITGQGRVVTVNVGAVREIEWLGRTWTTAIWKSPVRGRVRLQGVNLAGDDQADREVHGGADKAVYAYAREDSDWWEGQLGRPVEQTQRRRLPDVGHSRRRRPGKSGA